MLYDSDRREIARRMSLSYSALNQRLGGYTPWQPGEKSAFREIMGEIKTQKKEPPKSRYDILLEETKDL